MPSGRTSIQQNQDEFRVEFVAAQHYLTQHDPREISQLAKFEEILWALDPDSPAPAEFKRKAFRFALALHETMTIENAKEDRVHAGLFEIAPAVLA